MSSWNISRTLNMVDLMRKHKDVSDGEVDWFERMLQSLDVRDISLG